MIVNEPTSSPQSDLLGVFLKKNYLLILARLGSLSLARGQDFSSCREQGLLSSWWHMVFSLQQLFLLQSTGPLGRMASVVAAPGAAKRLCGTWDLPRPKIKPGPCIARQILNLWTREVFLESSISIILKSQGK